MNAATTTVTVGSTRTCPTRWNCDAGSSPEPDVSRVLAHIGRRTPGTYLAEEESGDSRRRELLHASGGYGNL